MSRRMRLAELLPDIAGIPHALDIGGIVQDSRAIQPGDAFVAIAGFGAHGLNFIAQAKAAGAVATLFEPPIPEEFKAATFPATAGDMPMIAVPGLRARLGAMADRFHGEPSRTMTTVGVTGTNGKTSIVQLLAQAWTLRGRRAGTIGTLGAGLYGEAVPTGFTTPLCCSCTRCSRSCATQAPMRWRWKSARMRSTRAALTACISRSACSPI